MRSPAAWVSRSITTVLLIASVACSGGGGGGGGNDPGFTLGRTSVDFTAKQGGTLPAPQAVTVAVSAKDAAYVVSGFPPGTTQPTWLSLSLSGSGTNGVLTLSISTTNLSPATYTTTVRVLLARSDQSVIGTRDIAVSYVVSPSLTASPTQLAFSHVIDATPSTQSLAVGGSSGVAFTASANQPWVTLSATTGTTPASITVGFDPTGLAVGSHAASVTIAGGGQSVIVPVTLEVLAPQLVVSTTTLTFTGVNGAPIATQFVDVSMNNGTAAAFTATPAAGWVVLDHSSGTTPARITVSVDPTVGPLASGAHASSVTFSASPGGTPLTATVNVQATLSKATLTAPSSLVLGGPDGRDFSAKQVQLSLDTGANAHSWSAVASDGWMSLSAASGSVSATPAAIDVTPLAAGLVGGTRTGSIAFTATVNGDSVTASVPVTFNLESHKLLASAQGVAFASTPGPSRLTRTLRVTDNLGLAAPWTATSDQTWLSVTASGTADGDLVLTADPTGLAADALHLAKVTLASSDATVENTETVRVGLWIGSTAPAANTAVTGTYAEIAGDPIRPYAYVHANGSSISVFNVYTGAQVGTISAVGGQLAGMAVSGDGSKLYAVDKATFKVVPVDLDSSAVGTAIALASTGNVYPRVAWTRTGGQPVLVVTDGTFRDPADLHVLASHTPPSYYTPRVAASLDGSVACDSLCRSLSWTSLGGGVLTVSALLGSVGEDDGALSPDGSVVYRPYMTNYHWNGYSTTTGALVIQLQWNQAYPNNVEVGWDGRIYCGRTSALNGEPDVWAFTPAGAEIGTLRVAGSYANSMGASQMVLSGDGLRLLALTSDYSGAQIRFVTTPP